MPEAPSILFATISSSFTDFIKISTQAVAQFSLTKQNPVNEFSTMQELHKIPPNVKMLNFRLTIQPTLRISLSFFVLSKTC